jgi:hypothetical protein
MKEAFMNLNDVYDRVQLYPAARAGLNKIKSIHEYHMSETMTDEQALVFAISLALVTLSDVELPPHILLTARELALADPAKVEEDLNLGGLE